MRVHCWIRLDKCCIERMHNGDGDVCSVSRWQLVRWQRGPTRCMYMLSWLLFACWHRDSVL